MKTRLLLILMCICTSCTYIQTHFDSFFYSDDCAAAEEKFDDYYYFYTFGSLGFNQNYNFDFSAPKDGETSLYYQYDTIKREVVFSNFFEMFDILQALNSIKLGDTTTLPINQTEYTIVKDSTISFQFYETNSPLQPCRLFTKDIESVCQGMEDYITFFSIKRFLYYYGKE